MKKRKSRDLYQQPRFVKRFATAGQTFWFLRKVITCLVIWFIFQDAVTLMDVYDRILYQDLLLLVVLVVGSALTIDYIPVLGARLLHYYRYGLFGVRRWMLWALAALYAVLFCGLFWLRWEARDVAFGGAETSMVVAGQTIVDAASTDTGSGAATAMTVLLGLLPGVTSGLSFLLEYIGSDPVLCELHGMELLLSEAYEQANNMYAARLELDQPWEQRLNALDDARLHAACEVARRGTAYIKARARYLLAERLGDPNSISLLTEKAA